MWFVFKRDRQFLPPMIRTVVGGGDAACLKQTKKEESTKTQEGRRRDTKRDDSAASARLQPGKPARACLRSKSVGSRPTRERGRPARMLCRSVPLRFPGMWHPSTLPAGTAWARPTPNPGAVAGRAGWKRWVRLCQCCAGGTPAFPGGLLSMTASQQSRSMGIRVYSCSFVVRLCDTKVTVLQKRLGAAGH